MTPLRVILADDHALVRAGIRSLLERLPGVEIVAEADNGEAALAAVAQHHPDVLFTDIAMPGLSGLDAAARVAAEHPGVKVIILSMYANEEYVLRALRAGAAGYVLKDAPTAQLELALSAVRRGEIYLCPPISRTVIEGYLSRVSTGGAQVPTDPLTARQQQVLKLIAEGRSTKEIAFELEISVKTVETHRAQIMKRLGIQDVAGLVRRAMRLGLIPPADGV